MSKASRSPSARRSDLTHRFRCLCAAVLCGAFLSAPVVAQSTAQPPAQSVVLTIDSDRLFEDSAFGRETVAEIERMGAALAAENRRIEEELIAEERALTEVRPTTDPVEFRALADAFDEKVQETRRRQDAKSRELNAKLEERRVVFLNAAVPVLEQLMRDTGASVVLERRTVFISANAIDITQIAIERLDQVLDARDMQLLDSE